MSQARYIFTLTANEHTRRIASNLASAFFNDEEKVELRNLSGEGCFPSGNLSALKKMAIYADGSEREYGGYSASEFAKMFNQRFLESFSESEKSKVGHLYLIGCDVGVIGSDTGAGSLAQKIADELDQFGFRQAVIHGVAKPENAKGDSLYLEVLNCSGTLGLLTAVKAISHGCGVADMQTGYLKAYLLNGADAARVAGLQARGKQDDPAISDIIREHSFLLVNHVHPVKELDKPQNIFYPRETLDNRKLRVERDTVRQCTGEHAIACNLLMKHRDDLRAKGRNKELIMARAMSFLIDRVHESVAQYWPQVVGEALRYFKHHALYSEHFNASNATTKLLDALSAGNIKKASKILGVKRDKNDRKGLTIFQSRQPEVAMRSSVIAEPVVPRMPANLSNSIAQLATDLQQEIKGLQRGCYPWLCFSKIRTKQAKLDVVNQLMECSNLVDAKQIARNALADTCVVAGMWHSRTNDLLKEIDQYQPGATAGLGVASYF